jgi:hypothetical protein
LANEEFVAIAPEKYWQTKKKTKNKLMRWQNRYD